MDKLKLFHTLMAMAAADGGVQTAEVEYLSACAEKWGISQDQLEECIASVSQTRIQLELPVEHDQKLETLEQMLRVMAADGRLHPREMNLFSQAAARMEISAEDLDSLLNRVLAKRGG